LRNSPLTNIFRVHWDKQTPVTMPHQRHSLNSCPTETHQWLLALWMKFFLQSGSSKHTGRKPRRKSISRQLGRFLKILGPGLISGAANDDPSAIATCARAGASFGFQFLWTAPFTFPMMASTVYLCSKLGMTTGMGIAGVLRRHYSRWLLYPIVVSVLIANVMVAGADIGAVAASLQLIVHAPVFGLTLGIVIAVLLLVFWGTYNLVHRFFRWLALALFAYVAAGILVRPELRTLLWNTFVPDLRWDPYSVAMLLAIIGSRLSPYLYFWQSSQVVEEKTFRRAYTSRRQLKRAAWDINLGMFFSNLIVYFVILCTATALFQHGRIPVISARDAALALQPFAGRAATLLFAVGVTGVGILAIPVLTTGSAYALAETFGWEYGIKQPPGRAKEFYAVIALSTCVALAIGLSSINAITALYWASIVMGFLAAPLMLVIMLATNNRKIMGPRANGIWANVLGWTTTLVTFAAVLGLLWNWID
jgi:NRAMP (natural resistance-associated macrophage protein)-like metal ion transporter